MHNTSRNCTRCGKDLTDAASMEAGIGPVCRDLDNALLARLIPSDLPKAQEAFNAVDLTAVAPETLKTLNEVYSALFADGAAARDDWRLEVKRIEWALSYPANNYMRSDLTNVVASLGYIGLAALWSGEAKSGLATITFANGRLFLPATSGAANDKIRVMQGRRWHPKGVSGFVKKAWSLPAKSHDEVYLLVIKHYPNFEGLTESIEQAKKFVAAQPQQIAIDVETHPVVPVVEQVAAPAPVVAAAPPPAPKPAPKCTITQAGVLLKIATPYKPEYVNELKTSLKYTDRRWNAFERVWEVPLCHRCTMETLVKKYFNETPAVLEG